MDNTNNIHDAGLYTDFSGLARLKTRAAAHSGSAESDQATKEVARQFESLFLQMALKSMRDASQLSESTDSDQTRFYMEMFDKQIALDLAGNGSGIGLADRLERDLGGAQDNVSQEIASLRGQIERPTSIIDKAGAYTTGRLTADQIKVDQVSADLNITGLDIPGTEQR